MKHKAKLELYEHNLYIYKDIIFNKKRSSYRESAARLATLDPKATLKRGYSITRTRPDYQIVDDPARVASGQLIEITVAKGYLNARVDKEIN